MCFAVSELAVNLQRHSRQRDYFETLHARVLTGDPVAEEEVCAVLLASGQRVVRARRKTADPLAVEDAVLSAITVYMLQPRRFDPGRSSLLTWISLIAIRDVDDHLQRQAVRRAAETVAAREAVASSEPAKPFGIKPVLLQAAKTRRDRRFLVAWLRQRAFKDLVGILAISEESPESQIEQVKRLKERLRLRMKRIARTIR